MLIFCLEGLMKSTENKLWGHTVEDSEQLEALRQIRYQLYHLKGEEKAAGIRRLFEAFGINKPLTFRAAVPVIDVHLHASENALEIKQQNLKPGDKVQYGGRPA